MPPKIALVDDASTVSTAPTRRPNLLVMHGEKGGVGKSFAAALAASTALYRGLSVHIIETDSAVPDVAPRFIAAPGAAVSAIALDRGSEAAETLTSLLSGVEALITAPNPPALIVINSPAGASGVLDTYAEIFDQVAQALDLSLTVGFMVDDSAAVLPRIEASIATGLLSIPTARRGLVYTGWRGDIAKFPVATSSARASALATGLVEHVFPGLTPASMLETVRKSDKPIYDLLDPAAGLKIVDRSLLSRWLKQAEPLTDWLIGGSHG